MSYVIMMAIKPQHVNEGGLAKIVHKYCSEVLKNNGIIRNIRNNGIRRMAYPFYQRGDRKAYFDVSHVCIEFFAPSRVPKALEDIVKTDVRVLRLSCLDATETLPIIPYDDRIEMPKNPERQVMENLFKRSIKTLK